MRAKRSRFYFPLLLGVILLAAYYAALETTLFISSDEVRETVFGREASYLLFAAVAALIVFAVRVLDWFLFDFLASRRTTIVAPLLLREILSIVFYIILFSWAVSWVFNYSVRGLLATTTVVAAVVGLALQDTLGNLFAGISLHLERTFDVGDVVKSGDLIGVVEGVNWRAARLRTFRNHVVVLPNSLLARERLEIFPRNNANAELVTVGVHYDAEPAKVIEVLERAVQNVAGVLNDPPALARVAAFGESAVNYEIKYWTATYQFRDGIDAEIRRAIWYALRRHELTIPYPIRTLYMAEKPAAAATDRTSEVLERLGAIDVLAPLSEGELKRLAAATEIASFARGETILRAGEEGDSMFVVQRGRVSVRVLGDSGSSEIAQLGEGSVFGEMALLTGERRTADVIASEDVVAFEISKEALQPLLTNNPTLAEAISARMAERRVELESAKNTVVTEEARSLLRRIRSYFHL